MRIHAYISIYAHIHIDVYVLLTIETSESNDGYARQRKRAETLARPLKEVLHHPSIIPIYLSTYLSIYLNQTNNGSLARSLKEVPPAFRTGSNHPGIWLALAGIQWLVVGINAVNKGGLVRQRKRQNPRPCTQGGPQPYRCQANVAHIRQSRPESCLSFQVKTLQTF